MNVVKIRLEKRRALGAESNERTSSSVASAQHQHCCSLMCASHLQAKSEQKQAQLHRAKEEIAQWQLQMDQLGSKLRTREEEFHALASTVLSEVRADETDDVGVIEQQTPAR